MAWKDFYTDVNKVEIIPQHSYTRSLGSYTSDALIAYDVSELINEYVFKYVGMDKTTALACQVAQVATYGAVGGKVTLERIGSSSGWNCKVNVYQSIVSETPL